MIVYLYEGQYYPASAVDHDPKTGKADVDGYERWEIPNKFTLTAQDCLEGYGSIHEILVIKGLAKHKP